MVSVLIGDLSLLSVLKQGGASYTGGAEDKTSELVRNACLGSTRRHRHHHCHHLSS